MKTRSHVGREVGLPIFRNISRVCLCSAMIGTRFLLRTKTKIKDLERFHHLVVKSTSIKFSSTLTQPTPEGKPLPLRACGYFSEVKHSFFKYRAQPQSHLSRLDFKTPLSSQDIKIPSPLRLAEGNLLQSWALLSLLHSLFFFISLLSYKAHPARRSLGPAQD